MRNKKDEPRKANDRTNGSPGDLRRYARFEHLECAIVIQREGEEGLRCMVVDIGLGGVQLRTKEPLKTGVECALLIGRDDGSAPMLLKGEVRYCEPTDKKEGLHASGFRFLPESHEERLSVAEYVHAVFSRQSDLLTTH